MNIESIPVAITSQSDFPSESMDSESVDRISTDKPKLCLFVLLFHSAESRAHSWVTPRGCFS